MTTRQIKERQHIIVQLQVAPSYEEGYVSFFDARGYKFQIRSEKILAVSDVPFYSGGELKADDPVLVQGRVRQADDPVVLTSVDARGFGYNFKVNKRSILGYDEPEKKDEPESSPEICAGLRGARAQAAERTASVADVKINDGDRAPGIQIIVRDLANISAADREFLQALLNFLYSKSSPGS